MDYLECNKCHQQYELLDGEKPEDFNLECGCGGQLKHRLDDDEQFLIESNTGYVIENRPFDFRSLTDISKGFKTILKIIISLIIGFGTIFWLLAFWPVGLLCILLCMAWIKIIT